MPDTNAEEEEYPGYEEMHLLDFIKNVRLGAFTDDDGYGIVFIGPEPNEWFSFVPSQLVNMTVRWFNK